MSNSVSSLLDMVTISIERIKAFEPQDGYYLAFSGGKDSQCVYHLAKKAGVKFDAHYSLTTVDPPELVNFIRSNYPDVKWSRPKMSMWQLIVKHGMPPTRKIRYCCEYLKENTGSGRLVLTGIRASESVRRSKRHMIEDCKIIGENKRFLHPIIDWTENDVWDFLTANKISTCTLYAEGRKRLGCIMCPQGDTKQMIDDALRWPKYYNAYLRAFDRAIKRRRQLGRKIYQETAQKMMDWWISSQCTDSGDISESPLFCKEVDSK